MLFFCNKEQQKQEKFNFLRRKHYIILLYVIAFKQTGKYISHQKDLLEINSHTITVDMYIKLWYDYSYQSYKGEANMNIRDGKYAWMVKIGEKGQFVIPKEARELFDFQPGDEILVLGDSERGIAILPKAKQQDTIKQVFSEIEE